MSTIYDVAKLAGVSPARHSDVTAGRMLLERIAGDDQPARTVILRNVLEPAASRPAISYEVLRS
jgi:DNA-binding LacI/PurR family transcriptional regulator